VLLQEGQLTNEKYPRCHVIKENEAKKQNSLMWGGGYKMAKQAILPPPQWQIQDLSHKKVVKFG
jgi:hypothetical protein